MDSGLHLSISWVELTGRFPHSAPATGGPEALCCAPWQASAVPLGKPLPALFSLTLL